MSSTSAICIGLFVFLTSGPTIASQLVELEHDPFSYLKIEVSKSSRRAKTMTPIAAKAKWQPKLRATIVAGEMSVANVEGKVVRIGEKLNGFTLITVGSQTATFEKDHRSVILKMTPKRKKK